jgi:hypothetical protein
VYVREVEIVSVGNRLRTESALFYLAIDVSDGDPTALDVWLVVEVGFVARDDTVYLDGARTHTEEGYVYKDR